MPIAKSNYYCYSSLFISQFVHKWKIFLFEFYFKIFILWIRKAKVKIVFHTKCICRNKNYSINPSSPINSSILKYIKLQMYKLNDYVLSKLDSILSSKLFHFGIQICCKDKYPGLYLLTINFFQHFKNSMK